MYNTDMLCSIFKTYGINNVLIKENSDNIDFIISNMSENISLERWNYLEAILTDCAKKNITILTYNQALENLGSNYIQESKVLL